jgi:hypothetical protein
MIRYTRHIFKLIRRNYNNQNENQITVKIHSSQSNSNFIRIILHSYYFDFQNDLKPLRKN